jgi:hypothetical protein
VRLSGGYSPHIRHAALLMPLCRAARLAGRFSWAARAVAVWGVLAGLFLMHGLASAGNCCEGGVPATAVTVVTGPLMAGPAAAGVVADAGRLTGARSQARVLTAASAPYAGSARDLQATASAGDSCRGGMLCSSRQPRETHHGALKVPQAITAVFTAAMLLPSAARVYRSDRPPGRPGLPLPLFLGVSRT